jgi:chorismate mutase/prephenate dehydratase
MRIEELRRRIDELDRQIVALLDERAGCARAIGEAKDRRDLPAFDPAREAEVLRAVRAASRGPLAPEALAAVYREILAGCRALQRPLTVAYWGPPASNTHVAARQRFGPEACYLPTTAVADVFAEVERGRAEFGVVPVENSTEGVVTWTLDRFLQTPLRICGELYVQIHHHLLSRERELAQVRRLFTMPQATAQCREWLRDHLVGVERLEVSTTARAAELAAAEEGAAAIANRAAAEEYRLDLLAEQIEDNPRNRTRFLVLGTLEPPPTGRDKTSLVISVSHEAGALHRATGAFADHGISMTLIQSRPTKVTPFEYDFFIDVLGHVQGPGEHPPLAAALRDLQQRALVVKVLGSYPEAEP